MTVEDRLRRAAAALDGPAGAVPPFGRVRQRARRRRAIVSVGIAVVLVAGAGTLVATAATTGRAKILVANPGSTMTTRSPTTRSTSPPARMTVSTRALASLRLDAYVESQQTKESAAGLDAPANVWGNPVLAEHSAPVAVGDRYVAVAAFSFDPAGRPLQVLAYVQAKWSVVATLPAPSSPGTVSHPGALDLIAEAAPIEAAHLTEARAADFLVEFAGGGCFSAALVASSVENGWRYVSFTGPFPTSEVLGGDPQLVNGSLATTNNCAAVPLPANQRRAYTWTYDAASGNMVGHQQSGASAPPLGTSPPP